MAIKVVMTRGDEGEPTVEVFEVTPPQERSGSPSEPRCDSSRFVLEVQVDVLAKRMERLEREFTELSDGIDRKSGVAVRRALAENVKVDEIAKRVLELLQAMGSVERGDAEV